VRVSDITSDTLGELEPERDQVNVVLVETVMVTVLVVDWEISTEREAVEDTETESVGVAENSSVGDWPVPVADLDDVGVPDASVADTSADIDRDTERLLLNVSVPEADFRSEDDAVNKSVTERCSEIDSVRVPVEVCEGDSERLGDAELVAEGLDVVEGLRVADGDIEYVMDVVALIEVLPVCVFDKLRDDVVVTEYELVSVFDEVLERSLLTVDEPDSVEVVDCDAEPLIDCDTDIDIDHDVVVDKVIAALIVREYDTSAVGLLLLVPDSEDDSEDDIETD
jgi:hypothetical protein